MANRIPKLGGTTALSAGDEIKSADHDDSWEAIINYAGVGIAQNAYKTLQANNVFENKDFLIADEFVTASGTNGTVNITSTSAIYDGSEKYINDITSTSTESSTSISTAVTNSDRTFTVDIKTTGYISQLQYQSYGDQTGSNLTLTITDSSSNVIVSKSFAGVNTSAVKTVSLSVSDYSRLLKANETVTVNWGNALTRAKTSYSYTGTNFDIPIQTVVGGFSTPTTPIIFTHALYNTSDTVVCDRNTKTLDGSESSIVVYADKETPTNTDITLDVLQAGSAITKDISTEVSGTNNLFFSSNGNSFYILNGSSGYQYNMTTPFDISTATYYGSFNVPPQFGSLQGLYLSTDGTTAHIVTENNFIFKYILSTPYDITTASSNGGTEFSTYISEMTDIIFSSDGTKMFLIDNSDKTIKSYTLSTAWSYSSYSNDNKSFDIDNAIGGKPQALVGCIFNNNGTKLFATFSDSYTYEFTLSTAYDLSTATYNGKYIILNSSGGSTYNKAVFGDSGNKLFIADNSNKLIVKYDLLNNYDISAAYLYPIINSITNQPINSTIDISSLGSGTLQLQFNLSTTDTSVTPKIYGWGVYLK